MAGGAADAAAADWGEEKVFFEGPPSYGDLATNLALGITLLWLVRARPPDVPFMQLPHRTQLTLSAVCSTQPLTLAAIGRSAWVYYKVRQRRRQRRPRCPAAPATSRQNRSEGGWCTD